MSNKMGLEHFRRLGGLRAAVVLLTLCGAQDLIAATAESDPSGAATSVRPAFTALVKAHGSEVVNISTVVKRKLVSPYSGIPELSPDDPFYEFFKRFGFGDLPPQDFNTQSLGSGFIATTDGYILTNSHVVEDADDVTVTLNDKREFKATVVGADKRTDVALLKIPATNLAAVTVGDPAKLEVGEWVVAIGSPAVLPIR